MRKGFTLVELMVSLTIFALLLGGVYYALGTELNLWKKISASAESQQIAGAVLTRLCRDARAAKAILPASNTDRLQLKIGSDIIEYSLSSHKVKRKKNNSSAYLTDKNEIQALSFSYPATRLVQVKIDNFETKFFLRN